MSALARLTTSGRDTAGPTLLRLAGGRGPGLMLRAGLMALAAAVLMAGLLATRETAERHPAAGPAVPRWSDINHPIALYDLGGTEFGRLPLVYRARRSRPDGAREDLLTFGQLGDAKPYLQLSLLRVGTEAPGAERTDGLAEAVARLADGRGLAVTRIRAAAAVDTRLGRIEMADLLLWDGGASTPCMGFVGAPEGGGVLRIAGVACGASGRPLARAALACAVDRIDLVSAGDDDPLRALFVAAERRSGATCLAASPPAAAGSLRPGRLGWLDPGAEVPPLRGLFEAASRQR